MKKYWICWNTAQKFILLIAAILLGLMASCSEDSMDIPETLYDVQVEKITERKEYKFSQGLSSTYRTIRNAKFIIDEQNIANPRFQEIKHKYLNKPDETVIQNLGGDLGIWTRTSWRVTYSSHSH